MNLGASKRWTRRGNCCAFQHWKIDHMRVANDNDVGCSPEPTGRAARPINFASALPPRGLSRNQAAGYIGVSPSLFDKMVADGRMPGPKRINKRTVWDRI